MCMLNKIRQAICDYDMIRKGDDILIALSGGADSVSLCHAMVFLSSELGITVRACHINHNLRGEESDSDEEFVREFCDRNRIPLVVKSVDVLSSQKKHESVEECARRLRYAAFDEISYENTKITTAHTASDNAETILLNLTRGTALKGLRGIPPVRDNIIRPLIYCSRGEIEEYCGKNNLRFVTDKTNFDEVYSRNKIRHSVIPRLTEINPSLLEGLTRMSLSLYEDNEYLTAIAAEYQKRADLGDGFYDVEILCGLDNCILHRIIRNLLEQSETDPSNLRITSAAQIIREKHGKINLRRNVFAIVHKGKFSIQYILQNYRERN